MRVDASHEVDRAIDPVRIGLWSWVVGSGVAIVFMVVLPTLMEVLL